MAKKVEIEGIEEVKKYLKEQFFSDEPNFEEIFDRSLENDAYPFLTRKVTVSKDLDMDKIVGVSVADAIKYLLTLPKDLTICYNNTNGLCTEREVMEDTPQKALRLYRLIGEEVRRYHQDERELAEKEMQLKKLQNEIGKLKKKIKKN